MVQANPDYGVMDTMAPTATPQARWLNDAAWAIVANLSQAAGPFLGLILISQAQGLEAAGRFAYAQALTTPIVLLLSFQLKALLLTHSAQELSTASAAGIRVLSTALGVAIAFALLLLFSPMAGLLMAARLVDSWAELFQADQQRSGRMWRSGLSAAVRAGCFLGAIAFTGSAEQGVAAYFVLSFILLVVFDMDSPGVGLNFDPAIWRCFLSRGALLGTVLFLNASQSSFPRLTLGHYTNEAALGSFATLSVLLQAGNLVASAFGQGLLPALATASLRRVIGWAVLPAVAGVVAFGAIFLAGDLFFQLFRVPRRADSAQTLLALGVSQIVVWPSAMIGYALTARRIYNQQIYLSLAMIAVAAISSLLLVPRYGAPGAAATLGISSTAMLLVSFWLLNRNIGSQEAQ